MVQESVTKAVLTHRAFACSFDQRPSYGGFLNVMLLA